MYGTSLPSLLKRRNEKYEIHAILIDECYEVKFVISNAVISHVKKKTDRKTKKPGSFEQKFTVRVS